MSLQGFLLQINPKKEYRLFDALQELPDDSKEIVLNDGRRKPWLEKGARVYLWEAGGRDLIGRGMVLESRAPREMPVWQRSFFSGNAVYEPSQERAVIQLGARIDPVSRASLQHDPVIGNATFFKNAKNITGTVFRVNAETADAIDALVDRLDPSAREAEFDPNAVEDTRTRSLREIAVRQGQPEFRSELLDAYEQRCAITDSDAVDCLEAAHILPYVNQTRNLITNGILLRSDVHTLFDLHLLTIVGADYRIRVAPKLEGTEYGRFIASRKLRLPKNIHHRPSESALERHRSQCEWM